MAENVLRMDGEDDPERCQGVTSQGQCTNKAVEGSQFCIAHGGNQAVSKLQKDSLRNYRLTKWKARIQRQSESPGIKSLREEIGILRMLMEERLNSLQSETDLLLQSGQLLDKQAILQFAGRIIDIIAVEVADESKIESIADKIMSALGDFGDSE
jgi:hypothetical protein